MLKASNLIKREGEKILLHDISFTIDRGEIFGLIGPNGAGKTTVLRMVSGLLQPDGGEIYLDQLPLYRHPWPKKPPIGYVPERFGISEHISIEELITFYASTHGLRGKDRKILVDQVLELVGLHALRREEASRLWVDDQKFLALAAVLVGNPRLLVLDEPTTGMDPGHRQSYIRIVRELSQQGTSVLLSSHMLSDLDQICHSIAVINNGVIVRQGRSDSIRLEADKENPIQIQVLASADQAANILRRHPKVLRLTMDETRLAIWFDGDPGEETELLAELVREGIPVISYTREKKNLESLFFRMTDPNLT